VVGLDIPIVLNSIAALAVIFGVGFAVVQVRQAERKRRDAAAVQFVNSYLSPEFMRAIKAIDSLPAQVSAQDVTDKGMEEAASTANYVFEALGIVVYERIVPLRILDNLVGMRTRASWSRLRPWVEERRRLLDRPAFGEWFQWLAERLEENLPPGRSEGAHVRLRDWRP
jgi:hypothetical protein